ncbi:oxidation resistance protein 1 [Bachmanniomyces sp. S44760]|nr:oxidation resistance protein 1 [Bachmanniomyces sp. S44760]
MSSRVSSESFGSFEDTTETPAAIEDTEPPLHEEKQVQKPRSHARTPSSYVTYPVSHVVSGLYRRLTDSNISTPSRSSSRTTSQTRQQEMNGRYTPPVRTASPFQPPPLSPLTLGGIRSSTSTSAQILSRALAEEIRLLVPPRLQLVEDWTLTYSIEQDGTSLSTLYSKCDEHRGKRSGFVLVVRDGAGGIFGAFLTDPPHPSPHYYGTGECFLWRASLLSHTPLLSHLPPPPSTDTTHLQRSTTIASPTKTTTPNLPSLSTSTTNTNGHIPPPSTTGTGTSTPERIRFKAFPYSGVNDYMIFCEADYLSVGAGDGHYGLWLDRVLERGISAPCLTFGNEGLSEEGVKFEVVGVEVWYIGV